MSTPEREKHRGSHVGNISLGDTAVPAFLTMPLDPKKEKESRRRVRALSVSTDNSNPGSNGNGSNNNNGGSGNNDRADGRDYTSDSTESTVSSPVEPSLGKSSSADSETHPVIRVDCPTDSHESKDPQANNSLTSVNASEKKKRRHKNHTHSSSQKPLSPIMRLWYGYREYAYRNTWFTPLLIFLAIIMPYELSSNKTSSNWFHMFSRLSYEFEKDPLTGSNPLATVAPFYDYPVYPSEFTMYGKGLKDFGFVFTAMVFFMFFREFCMQVLLRPLAKFCGLKKRAKIDRFMEQTYAILYFSMSTPFGLYIMYHNPENMWYYNTNSFYLHYPHKAHDTLFKLFYLLQAGFWAQQSLVLMLQLEKPRRDFYELVFHHVVTIALIYLSYHFHFAMIGIAVFITMDASDIFLSVSKTLNYLDSWMTMPMFGFFMGVWIYTRHYLNLRILWSILTEFREVGPFVRDMSIGQYKCLLSQAITFTLLLSLQLVNIYWLVLIIRVMVRFLLAGEQKDDRSDDEDEEEEYDDEKKLKQ